MCSTFVGYAWKTAGVILSNEGAKDKWMTPNEIVENKNEIEYIGNLEV